MPEITEEAIFVKEYIKKTWKSFSVELELSLRKMFPEPSNRGLKHIWKYGTCDVVVRKNDKIICVIEPGGSHHMQDEKQIKNDARKYKLCELNGVKCIHVMNGVIGKLSNRKMRKLLGKYLW